MDFPFFFFFPQWIKLRYPNILQISTFSVFPSRQDVRSDLDKWGCFAFSFFCCSRKFHKQENDVAELKLMKKWNSYGDSMKMFLGLLTLSSPYKNSYFSKYLDERQAGIFNLLHCFFFLFFIRNGSCGVISRDVSKEFSFLDHLDHNHRWRNRKGRRKCEDLRPHPDVLWAWRILETPAGGESVFPEGRRWTSSTSTIPS